MLHSCFQFLLVFSFQIWQPQNQTQRQEQTEEEVSDVYFPKKIKCSVLRGLTLTKKIQCIDYSLIHLIILLF